MSSDLSPGQVDDRRRRATEELLSAFQRVIPSVILYNERVARQIGLPLVDAQLLHAITLTPEGLTPGELRDLSAQPPSSITRIVDRLEAKGFAHRVPDHADRRSVRVVADPDALTSFVPHYQHFGEQMTGLADGFEVTELEAIARYLRGLAESG